MAFDVVRATKYFLMVDFIKAVRPVACAISSRPKATINYPP